MENSEIEIDAEKFEKVTIGVRVRDDPENTAFGSETGILTIFILDENDNDPIFTKPAFTGEIEELSKIGTIVPVNIEARDFDVNEENRKIVYKVIEPVPFGFKAGNLVVTGKLDFEARKNYTFSIQATDPTKTGNRIGFFENFLGVEMHREIWSSRISKKS